MGVTLFNDLRPRVTSYRHRVVAVLVGVAAAAGLTLTVASPAAAAYPQCNVLSVAVGNTNWVTYPTYATGGGTPTASCEVRWDESPDAGQRLAIWELQWDMKICHGETSLATDGLFGPSTYAAVQRVQRALGLSDDGKAGPATRKAMSHVRAYSSGDACSAVPSSGPTFADHYHLPSGYPYTAPY
jgi:hypothetical protein